LRLAKFGYKRAIGKALARRSAKLPNWIHQTPITSGPSLELPRQRNQGKRINTESTEEEDTERTEERKENELEQQRHR